MEVDFLVGDFHLDEECSFYDNINNKVSVYNQNECADEAHNLDQYNGLPNDDMIPLQFATSETNYDNIYLQSDSMCNLYDNIDPKLLEADKEAHVTGKLTPLIKEELKWSIHSRRFNQGKQELEVTFSEPKKDELTSDDIVRRANRKEKNRIAAQRSRLKRRQMTEASDEELKALEEKNEALKAQLSSLTRQKIQYLHAINYRLPHLDFINSTVHNHVTPVFDGNPSRHAIV